MSSPDGQVDGMRDALSQRRLNPTPGEQQLPVCGVCRSII
jgi:hypothetical protein